MKYSQLVRGVRAEKSLTITLDGKDVPVLVRPLSAAEEIDVVGGAIKHAKSRGAEAAPGSTIYEAALMAGTVALALLDPDSDSGARQPFFDGGMAQVLDLDPDHLLTLYEQQQLWQDECSPSTRHKSTGELIDLARKVVAEGDPFEYARLAPGTRWALQLCTATLLHSAHVLKSPSTSPSSTSQGTPSSQPMS